MSSETPTPREMIEKEMTPEEKQQYADYKWTEGVSAYLPAAERVIAAMAARAVAAERERDEAKDRLRASCVCCLDTKVSEKAAAIHAELAAARQEIERLKSANQHWHERVTQLKSEADRGANCDEFDRRGEEIERLTKLNDLLMGDKHDWEKAQRRRELLEMVGHVSVGFIHARVGWQWHIAVFEAQNAIAAVDAAMNEQQP